MQIVSFWAKNYRSLRDVRLDSLGPFNIFYGPNGSGKSNILAAMQTLFGFLAARTRREYSIDDIHKPALSPELVDFAKDRDRCIHAPRQPMVLGAVVEFSTEEAADLRINSADTLQLSVEIQSPAPQRGYAITTCTIGENDLCAMAKGAASHESMHISSKQGLAQYLPVVHDTANWAYALVSADRIPYPEMMVAKELDVAHLLEQGRLKAALLVASRHPDPVVRQRYKQFQALLADEPLRRKPFEVTFNPQTEEVQIVENVGDSPAMPKDVLLDLAGLGIAQIYSILAQILFRDTRTVGLEEPEAHLHAPTSGIHLRQLLERLVHEHYIDQLFIATHSNLFDLDPTGYWDVALDGEKGTVVTRKPLSEIDAHHLYEPGPAKHALMGFLEYMDKDAVVFRRADGSPVNIGEMLDMLQRDDPLAVEFLRDVHAAAVRAVRVKHKDKKPA